MKEATRHSRTGEFARFSCAKPEVIAAGRRQYSYIPRQQHQNNRNVTACWVIPFTRGEPFYFYYVFCFCSRVSSCVTSTPPIKSSVDDVSDDVLTRLVAKYAFASASIKPSDKPTKKNLE
jgi:hypothetical protein